MKAKLAKIFTLIPFIVYGVLAVAYLIAYLDFIFGFLFGWIPSLASSVLGIAFHFLSPKESRERLFLTVSVANCIISLAWMVGILLLVLPTE